MAAGLLDFARVCRTYDCASCPDHIRVSRGCTKPLNEPDQWDYDPATHSIASTGEVVPRTCPRDTHAHAHIFEVARSSVVMLDRGWRRIDQMDARWLNIVLYVEHLMKSEKKRESRR